MVVVVFEALSEELLELRLGFIYLRLGTKSAAVTGGASISDVKAQTSRWPLLRGESNTDGLERRTADPKVACAARARRHPSYRRPCITRFNKYHNPANSATSGQTLVCVLCLQRHLTTAQRTTYRVRPAGQKEEIAFRLRPSHTVPVGRLAGGTLRLFGSLRHAPPPTCHDVIGPAPFVIFCSIMPNNSAVGCGRDATQCAVCWKCMACRHDHAPAMRVCWRKACFQACLCGLVRPS